MWELIGTGLDGFGWAYMIFHPNGLWPGYLFVVTGALSFFKALFNRTNNLFLRVFFSVLIISVSGLIVRHPSNNKSTGETKISKKFVRPKETIQKHIRESLAGFIQAGLELKGRARRGDMTNWAKDFEKWNADVKRYLAKTLDKSYAEEFDNAETGPNPLLNDMHYIPYQGESESRLIDGKTKYLRKVIDEQK